MPAEHHSHIEALLMRQFSQKVRRAATAELLSDRAQLFFDFLLVLVKGSQLCLLLRCITYATGYFLFDVLGQKSA